MRTAARDVLVITCEHGGNRIPTAYAPLFRDWQRALETHRGYDPGALAMARWLSADFSAPLVASTVSRLLVDLNRSLTNASVWSAATAQLPAADKARVVAHYYAPYRARMDAIVNAASAAKRRVVHLSSHSFTPTLDGTVRNADIGLLYDPARPGERALAARWQAALASNFPRWRVRRNYPYAGKNDGLTATLRKRLPPTAYVGIELECNQAIALAGGAPWRALRQAIVASLRIALQKQ